jgi:hypothetical protein
MCEGRKATAVDVVTYASEAEARALVGSAGGIDTGLYDDICINENYFFGISTLNCS